MAGIVENKVAIVTGAGRGIGRAIAMLMAEEGAKVLVNDVGAALDGSGGEVFNQDVGFGGEVQGELPASGTDAAQAAAVAVKRIASVGYVRSNLYILNGRTAGNVAVAEQAIAAGSRPNELTDGPAVALASNAQAAVVGVALGEASSSAFGFAREAKLMGFEGDACPECGNFTMVRNGTCLKCTTCGGTTGCS